MNKTIHYIHFGERKLSQLNEKCINSWYKFAPDYKIIKWDENNFDVNICDFCKDAYNNKAYAHASDYARLWIIYNYGGIYFDTDVELIKPFDNIKSNFFALEVSKCKNTKVATGLGFGANPYNYLIKNNMDVYHNIKFNCDNYTKNPDCPSVTTDCLNKMGYYFQNKDNIYEWKGTTFYPGEFFCPLDYMTGELNITENTKAIHHYEKSW